MKYLDRSLVKEPEVLKQYFKKRAKWRQLSCNKKDYQCVLKALFQMQGECCAYCGKKLHIERRGSYHIEHFFPRKDSSCNDFDWSNLFLCCEQNSKEYCGSYKDDVKNAYKSLPILKPDEKDPELYLVYEREQILCRQNSPDVHLSDCTIKRLNLNHKALLHDRRVVINEIDKIIMGFQDYEEIKDVLDCIKMDFIQKFGYEVMINQYFDYWLREK